MLTRFLEPGFLPTASHEVGGAPSSMDRSCSAARSCMRNFASLLESRSVVLAMLLCSRSRCLKLVSSRLLCDQPAEGDRERQSRRRGGGFIQFMPTVSPEPLTLGSLNSPGTNQKTGIFQLTLQCFWLIQETMQVPDLLDLKIWLCGFGCCACLPSSHLSADFLAGWPLSNAVLSVSRIENKQIHRTQSFFRVQIAYNLLFGKLAANQCRG